MAEDVDLFLALAEIAGVFVGFGALISVVRPGGAPSSDRIQVRGVVMTGLIVIAAALIPVGLARYAIDAGAIWRVSSLVFLLLIWASFLLPLRTATDREELQSQFRAEPKGFVLLLALEVFVQGPLLLVLLGRFRSSGSALYTTALVINLLQAALLLSQLVLSRSDGPE